MSMEQEDQGFEQGFASVMNPDLEQPAPAADAADAGAAGGEGEQGAAQDNADGSNAAADAGSTTPAADAGTTEAGEAGAAQAAGSADGAAAGAGGDDPGATADAGDASESDEEIVLDGLSRAELRNLLSRAAEVDGLKESLRKAHGKIGEMNGRLRTPPAQSAPGFGGISLAGLEGEAFDKAVSDLVAQTKIDAAAFGDFSEEGLTRGIVTTMLRLQQLNQQQPQAQQAPAQPGGQGAALPVDMPQSTAAEGNPQAEPQHDDSASAAAAQQQHDPSTTQIQVEQLVLDRVRPGWRETVSGQDFNMWLGAQDQSFQQGYLQANTAEQFAGVLDKFGQWQTARQAAVAKSAKAQERLERSLTPTGNAPKPQAAMTEDEEFEAAFNAIAKQRQ